MAQVVMPIILVIVMVGVFALLYFQGHIVLKLIGAVAFVGSMKGTSASFTACSGYIKRIITFKTDGIYHFTLDAELSKGDISVELFDAARQKIMQLNGSNRKASITVEKKKKYYLMIHFKSATGRYTLIQE